MHPRHARLRRALLLASLGALILTGCDLFRPARLTVTPATAYVDLSAGPRSAAFTVRNDGPSRSRLAWTFASPSPDGAPRLRDARWRRHAGRRRRPPRPKRRSAPTPPSSPPATRSFTVVVVTFMGLACEPEQAFAATADRVPTRSSSATAATPGAAASRAPRRATPRPPTSWRPAARSSAAGSAASTTSCGSPAGGRDALLDALRAAPTSRTPRPTARLAHGVGPTTRCSSSSGTSRSSGPRAGLGDHRRCRRPADPVVVAVVDDGLAVDHADLAAVVLPGTTSFTATRTRATAPTTARTSPASSRRCAGTLKASPGSRATPARLGCGVLPVKAWPDSSDPPRTTQVDPIARAIRWAAGLRVAGAPANAFPAAVINLSLGSLRTASPTFAAAIADAKDARGVVVVAAAGNAAATDGVDHPAGSGDDRGRLGRLRLRPDVVQQLRARA